jgi:hypothetical protein
VHEQGHDPPKMLPLQLHEHDALRVFEQLTVAPVAVTPPPVQPAPS